MTRIIRSTPHLSRPVWAGPALSQRFGKPGGEPFVGESWEVWRDNRMPDGRVLSEVVDFPVLIKLMSTRDVLSVQVHPDDATARRHGAASGKAEAWVIVEADPGARVALGLRGVVSREELRALALSGQIEEHLAWFDVQPGDVIDVPPGTIHAIGGGVTLYEIQQPADITWRLYDWGRGRELHLDDALEVAVAGPAAGPERRRGRLVEHPLFVVDELLSGESVADRWRALTCIAGELRVGEERVVAGDTVMVEPGSVEVAGDGRGLTAWVP